MILYLFAFLSGLATILAPCIWPILPILFISSDGGKRKPLGLSLGIVTSFALITILLSSILSYFSVNFDVSVIRPAATIFLALLGITFVIPALSTRFEFFVSKLIGKSSNVDLTKNKSGFISGFTTGLALGTLWSPCAGPILAAISVLVGTHNLNTEVLMLILAYSLGVGLPLFGFTLFGQKFIKRSTFISKYTDTIQRIFGILIILLALAIYTDYDKKAQAWFLDQVPGYSKLIYLLELNETVTKELDKLNPPRNQINVLPTDGNSSQQNTLRLPSYGKSREITGITNWINSEPLTIEQLKGNVVLIDFWTYTCINCIRTLPHLNSWHEKYKDNGLTIVGVHSPEFQFEKSTENVLKATQRYSIEYPVAQDNNFETWKNFDNKYWPAHYLIDAEGNIRMVHFGEGKYEELETAIQELLKEGGNTDMPKHTIQPQPTQRFTAQTPETYLGLLRMERYSGRGRPREIGTQNFEPTEDSILLDHIRFEGTWNIQLEYSESVRNSILKLSFQGRKVFLVMTPKSPGQKVKVSMNDTDLTIENSGEDVIDSVITLDSERLYTIIDQENYNFTIKEITLELDPGIKVYAFTFGN